eukprot:SAG11_NODE_7633_length_1118_cov_193.941119_1_plen_319_part_10
MSEEPDDPDLMSLLDMAEPEPELESLFREKYRETNPEIQAISRRVRCIQTYFRGRMARRRVNQIRHDLLTPAEQALIEADLELRHFTVNVTVSFYPRSFHPDLNFDLDLHSLVNEAGLMSLIWRKMSRIHVMDGEEYGYGATYETGEDHVEKIKITGPSVFWKCMNRGLLVWDFKVTAKIGPSRRFNRTNFDRYVKNLGKKLSNLNVTQCITVGTDGLQHMCVICNESLGIYSMDNGGMLCHTCMKKESYQWVSDFFDLAINDKDLDLDSDTKERLSSFATDFGMVHDDVQALMNCGEVFYIPKPIEPEPEQDSQESEA